MSKYLLCLFVLIFTCLADAKPNTKKSRKRSRVVDVDFDDELRIRGKLFGPSTFTLFQKKNLNYGFLIKPRKNFLPEMRETLGDID